MVVTLVGTGAACLAAPAGATAAATVPVVLHLVPASTVPASYQHGLVPTLVPALGQATSSAAGGSIQSFSSTTQTTTSKTLLYRGGIGGIGVLTGTPKVYLVYYGSQWGTQGTTTIGGKTYASFTGDTAGLAPVQQAFFAGLGTGGESWSGVMTQYCQGVAVGASTCPSSATHVGYSTNGVLAGVWEDTSAASPGTASPAQLAAEAEAAATHFNNTTQAANRSTQYIIVSPPGTHPNGFNTSSANFCAWHDYTGDTSIGTVSQPNGTVAFTNMPYLTDLGTSCGRNFVNAGTAGLLDGVTMVGGHEYAETVTDQFPAGGWTASSGAENGDLCGWISSGQGTAADVTSGTGTFAVQSTWGNDFNGGVGGCELTHPFLAASSNIVTITNPGSQTSTVGAAASLQVAASDTASGQTLTYSAFGLPAGLSMSASGLVSGTPTTAATSTVTVSVIDASTASSAVSFAWKVSAVPHVITVTNPGSQTSALATSVSLQIKATDSVAGYALTFSATNLPPGYTISSITGLITGKATKASTYSVTVKVTDSTGASGSAVFSWTT